MTSAKSVETAVRNLQIVLAVTPPSALCATPISNPHLPSPVVLTTMHSAYRVRMAIA